MYLGFSFDCIRQTENRAWNFAVRSLLIKVTSTLLLDSRVICRYKTPFWCRNKILSERSNYKIREFWAWILPSFSLISLTLGPKWVPYFGLWLYKAYFNPFLFQHYLIWTHHCIYDLELKLIWNFWMISSFGLEHTRKSLLCYEIFTQKSPQKYINIW